MIWLKLILLMNLFYLTVVSVGCGKNYDQDLYNAAVSGDVVKVQDFLEKGAYVNIRDNKGRSPLMYATAYGYTEVVKALIQKGANINVKDNIGGTPLHFAAMGLNTFPAQNEVTSRTICLGLLIKAGANVNAQDNDGQTPLMIAVGHHGLFGNFRLMVNVLLDANADITLKDKKGEDAFSKLGFGSTVAPLLQSYKKKLLQNTENK